MKVDEFIEANRGLDRATFCARNPGPFLIIDQLDESPAERQFQTQVAVSIEELMKARDYSNAEVLSIRPECDELTVMVTLGRAMNSNLVLRSASISKLHCFFRRSTTDGTWNVADAGSTNGTVLNGVALKRNDLQPLRDGACLEFGNAYSGRFVEADSLFDELLADYEVRAS